MIDVPTAISALVFASTTLTFSSASAPGAQQEPRASTAQVASEIGKREFLAWIKDNAIHIERWKMSPPPGSYLDQALQGKRIVFIGEPGHFFSEKDHVHILLIRYLATRGYRHQDRDTWEPADGLPPSPGNAAGRVMCRTRREGGRVNRRGLAADWLSARRAFGGQTGTRRHLPTWSLSSGRL